METKTTLPLNTQLLISHSLICIIVLYQCLLVSVDQNTPYDYCSVDIFLLGYCLYDFIEEIIIILVVILVCVFVSGHT